MPSQLSSSSTHNRATKLFYIDNIKILLTVRVILHHTVIAYCAPGGWYYTEKTARMAAIIPSTIFVSLNQSFFMGFFFLLSAYFTGSSYDRKGVRQYFLDRLMRLGIPLLFYSFVLSPLLGYMVYYFAKGRHISIAKYLSGYHSWIDFGVLWYVAALLVFTLLFILLNKFFTFRFKKPIPSPTTGVILLFAVLLGIISFFVRIIFPVGWVLEPFGFQLGHFPQYIALFIAGLFAYRNGWFDGLSEKIGRQLKLSAWLGLLAFPLFFLIRMKSGMPVAWYSGGFHWQALLYAVWEQWIGLSILTTLLISTRRSWNKSSRLLGNLARGTFAVYIFHPLAIVSLSLLVKGWTVEPAMKFLILAPLAIICSFILGAAVLRVPGVKKFV